MKLTVSKKKEGGKVIIRDERQHIVATFAEGPAGTFALGCFVVGFQKTVNPSLFDFNSNEFIVGGPSV